MQLYCWEWSFCYSTPGNRGKKPPRFPEAKRFVFLPFSFAAVTKPAKGGELWWGEIWHGKKITNCSFLLYLLCGFDSTWFVSCYNYPACSKIRVPEWPTPRARSLGSAGPGSGTAAGGAGLCPQIKHNCGGGGERNSHVHVAVTGETFPARLPVGLCFPSHWLTRSAGKALWMHRGGGCFKSLSLYICRRKVSQWSMKL